MSQRLRVQVVSEARSANIKIIGGLGEDTDQALRQAINNPMEYERIEIDCSEINYINSIGAGQWARFMESLSEDTDIRFSRCSIVLVSYMNMLPAMVGSAKVLSLALPYNCDGCGVSSLIYIDNPKIAGEAAISAPTCSKCGCVMILEGDISDFVGFHHS